MLKKDYRLRKSEDIERAVKRGYSVFGENLGVKFCANRLPLSRFAVVVGVKVHKRAVKRNAVKRRLREIIRLNLKMIKPGFDVVVLTKPSCVGRAYQELQKEILKIFGQAKLIN